MTPPVIQAGSEIMVIRNRGIQACPNECARKRARMAYGRRGPDSSTLEPPCAPIALRAPSSACYWPVRVADRDTRPGVSAKPDDRRVRESDPGRRSGIPSRESPGRAESERMPNDAPRCALMPRKTVVTNVGTATLEFTNFPCITDTIRTIPENGIHRLS